MSLKTPRKALVPHLKMARAGAAMIRKAVPAQTEINPQLLTIKSYRVLSGSSLLNTPTPNQGSNDLITNRAIKARSVCFIRDAVQSREWLQKARETITKELCLFINSSNCLYVEQPTVFCTYKYYLGKGNNSGLIKKCMNSRPWWVLVEEDQKLNAHFVWTQGKVQEYFDKMPAAYDKEKKINHDLLGKSITCQEIYGDVTSSLKNVDISDLGYDLITLSSQYLSFQENTRADPLFNRIQNKLEHSFHLSDKKSLYRNMKDFYFASGENVFEYLPLTFHIDSKGGEFGEFLQAAQDQPTQLWIVKPGENTNRGTGISITNKLSSVVAEVSAVFKGESTKTFVVQKYIEKPFLINKRKFDIRLYTLCTSINGVFQGYFYQEGYLRTACKAYNSNDMDKFIHLTNDAVQNKCEDYGKWENGNKLSYSDFQRYLDAKKVNVKFSEEVLPKLKKIVRDTIKATWGKMNKERRFLSFEVFGYDFLLDGNLKPWLLEVNTNPCLELAATNLARIIPAMIENALKIAIDPLFPEPKVGGRKGVYRTPEFLSGNKFELIFHQDASE